MRKIIIDINAETEPGSVSVNSGEPSESRVENFIVSWLMQVLKAGIEASAQSIAHTHGLGEGKNAEEAMAKAKIEFDISKAVNTPSPAKPV